MSQRSLGKASDEVGSRLRQYLRREKIILWVGAGLAGIVALFAAIEFTRESELPAQVLPVIPVAVVFSWGCLAWARIQFEWAAEVLDRGVKAGKFSEQDKLPDELKDWPTSGECCYLLMLLGAFLAGIWIAVIAIWSAVAGPSTDACR